jgi:predicted metal-dependent peptidase
LAAILEGDFQREQKDRQSATKSQLSDIESERQQRQSTIEQERTGALGSLDQEKRLSNESRKQEFDAQLQASQDALTKARQEWEESLSQAADTKKESDSRRTPDRVRRAELELEGLDELIGQTQQKVDVVGSFNPIAALNLGSDTLAQRTAKSTEDVANNTKRLVQQADRGGVVFS